jgi:hypothetical protein
MTPEEEEMEAADNLMYGLDRWHALPLLLLFLAALVAWPILRVYRTVRFRPRSRSR